MKRWVAVALLATAQVASAGMVITEWMYNGLGTGNIGEFVEFTNVGTTPVDLTGWSFDDNSRVPGSQPLGALGIVAPGQSVILTDDTAAAFATNWGLTGVAILGGNTNNLGRSDEINLYDAGNALVDRLTYNDQAGQGPRTQGTSCNIPATDYGFDVAQSTWVLATVGDAYGSWASTRAEIGSPGGVPEPTSGLLLAGAALFMAHRRA